ncbi:MAG: TIGR01777 family oxidoreductase [Shewanella sp.]
MKILITGASGFIGRHWLNALADEHDLVIVSRQDANNIKGLPLGRINIVKLEALTHLNDFDVILNLAGEPIIDKRWTAAQKEKICYSRWHITDTLVKLLSISTPKPRVFISASAIGVYGTWNTKPQDETTPIRGISEQNPRQVDFAQQVCSTWEKKAFAAQSELTRVCIIRIGIVLGHGGALAKMKLPFTLGLGGKIASGKQGMSWIHIDDLTALMLRCLQDPDFSGIYNGTAPNPVSNNDFTQALGKQLQRPTLFAVPALVLNALFGESASLLTQGQYILPTRAINQGFQFNYPTMATALAQIYSKNIR